MIVSARAPPLDLEVWTAAGPDDDDVYCRAVMDFAMDTIGLAPAEAAQLVALYRVLRLVLGSSIAASDAMAATIAMKIASGVSPATRPAINTSKIVPGVT